eukprot:3338887-Heterocapsa_arctica.AAC.1
MDPSSLAMHARTAGRERAQGVEPQDHTIIMEAVLLQHPSYGDGWRRQMEANDAVQTLRAAQGQPADWSFRTWQQPTIISA